MLFHNIKKAEVMELQEGASAGFNIDARGRKRFLVVTNNLVYDILNREVYGNAFSFANTSAPAIAGVGYNGQTLTGTDGAYTITPDSISYQWYSDGSPVPGATSADYTVDATTEGAAIFRRDTATKAGYSDIITDSNTLHHFTAADLTTTLWLDAADQDTIGHTGGAVSQWDDKSGNDDHLTQSTGSKQPTTNSATLNSLNLIDFATDEFLYVANLAANTKSFIGVFVPNSAIDETTPSKVIWATGDTQNYPLCGFALGSVTGSITDEVVTVFDEDAAFEFQDRQGISSANLASISAAGHMVSAVRGASDWFMGYDGSNDLRDLTNGVRHDLNTGTASIGLYVGIQLNSTPDPDVFINNFDGKLAELLFFSTPLSTSDRQMLEGYLAWKWGMTSELPSAHPYKTNPPNA
jgi:hypothetical protein